MKPAMKAILASLLLAASGSPCLATEPPPATSAPSAQQRCEAVLRSAGAGPAELAVFDQVLDQQAPAERQVTADFLEHAPPEQRRGLVESLRQQAVEAVQHPTLPIGADLPDFRLQGVDGKWHTPADYRSSPVLVVMFVSNHCPASQMFEEREKRLHDEFAAKGVAFIAIQPDNPKAAAPSEHAFTDVDDSLKGMAIRAAYRNFPYPYLYDGEQQAAASAFGPKVTPHLFIFDRNRKLRYEGRVDNSLRESKATTHEARDAIEALLAGNEVPVSHTPVFGCSTKWNSRLEGAQRELEEWRARPVAVEGIGMEGLRHLREASPGKTLMINFWATWCGPCRTEFPDLLTTYQWYNSRGLDFISVSVDSPDSRADVLRFLDDVHSPVRNLQVDSEDVYALQKAVDPGWESGVPFTLVVAPDGKVIYRQEGELDILRMRRTILANLGDTGPFAGNVEYWRR